MAGKPASWAAGQKLVKKIDLSDGSTAEGIAIVDAAGTQVTSFGAGTGAATIADGADVVEGALADTAIITDTTGTVNGKLRGLIKWAFERMPASLGQKAMSASLPVVLASDQTSIPTTSAAPSAIFGFLTAVTTAGTRVQLASHAGLQGGVLEAPSTNTGIVYIGDVTVSATVYGAQLQPGQSVGIALANSNLVYIDAATNGDKVAFLGS